MPRRSQLEIVPMTDLLRTWLGCSHACTHVLIWVEQLGGRAVTHHRALTRPAARRWLKRLATPRPPTPFLPS